MFSPIVAEQTFGKTYFKFVFCISQPMMEVYALHESNLLNVYFVFSFLRERNTINYLSEISSYFCG